MKIPQYKVLFLKELRKELIAIAVLVSVIIDSWKIWSKSLSGYSESEVS